MNIEFILEQFLINLSNLPASVKYKQIPWYLVIGENTLDKSSFIKKLDMSFYNLNKADVFSFYISEKAIFIEIDEEAFNLGLQFKAEISSKNTLLKQLAVLILKVRPKYPINGIIVICKVELLLNNSEDRAYLYASSIEHSIGQIQSVFDSQVPSYLIITQLDTLLGAEQFIDLASHLKLNLDLSFSNQLYLNYSCELFNQEFKEQALILEQKLQRVISENFGVNKDILEKKKLFIFQSQIKAILPQLNYFMSNCLLCFRNVSFISLDNKTKYNIMFLELINSKYTRACSFNLPNKSKVFNYKHSNYFNNVLLADKSIIYSSLKSLNKLRRKRYLKNTLVLLFSLSCILTASYTYSTKNLQTRLVGKNITKISLALNTNKLKIIDYINILNQLGQIEQLPNFNLKILTKVLAIKDEIIQYKLMPMLINNIILQLDNAANLNEYLYLKKIIQMLLKPEDKDHFAVNKYFLVNLEKKYPKQAWLIDDINSYSNYYLAKRFKIEPLLINSYPTFKQKNSKSPSQLSETSVLYKIIIKNLLKKPPLDLKKAIGSNYIKIFEFKRISKTIIPYLYTLAGRKSFLSSCDYKNIQKLVAQNYLPGFTPLTKITYNSLKQDLISIYNKNHIKYWQNLSSNISYKHCYTIKEHLELWNTFLLDDPLKKLLKIIHNNYPKVNLLAPKKKLKLLSVQSKKLRDKLLKISNSKDKYLASFKILDKIGTNKDDFAILTTNNLYNKIYLKLYNQSSKLIENNAKQYLNQKWRDNIYLLWQRNYKNYYPFSKNAKDSVTLDKFNSFFAKDGILFTFKEKYLKHVLKKASFNNKKIQLINDWAENIEDMFFSQSGELGCKLTVIPVKLSSNVWRAVLEINGQFIDFKQTEFTPSIKINWPRQIVHNNISRLIFYDLSRAKPQIIIYRDRWSLFRLLAQGEFKLIDQSSGYLTFKLKNSFYIVKILFSPKSHSNLNFMHIILPARLYIDSA